jgi:signal transduction histidine kinase
MAPGFVFLPVLAAALTVAAAVAIVIVDHRRQGALVLAAGVERDRARLAEVGAVRALRLAAIELRRPATTLLGHADRLCADGANRPAGTTIGAIARQMLDLADDLQHHALADAASRVLRDEPTRLAAMLQDAVATVQASLEPGRRHWRLPAQLEGIEVIADRRALAQILARVLGCAARFSQHDDWIDVAFEITADRFTLTVADEGSGLAATEGASPPGQADTRGLGLGLALARVLMQAHGGALQVEAVPSVGTRVTLDFPMSRLAGVAPPSASIAAPVAHQPTGHRKPGFDKLCRPLRHSPPPYQTTWPGTEPPS